jgi:hypothetical protein
MLMGENFEGGKKMFREFVPAEAVSYATQLALKSYKGDLNDNSDKGCCAAVDKHFNYKPGSTHAYFHPPKEDRRVNQPEEKKPRPAQIKKPEETEMGWLAKHEENQDKLAEGFE